MKIKKIFKLPIKLNQVAAAIGEIIELLDLYEELELNKYLLKAAWTVRIGILDITDEYSFPMNTIIRIPVYGGYTKMTLHSALMKSIGRLSIITGDLISVVDTMQVKDILDKREAFYK